ncbi:MAG: hypothetical protein MJK14_10450 [Rivularia sp. ALOHA_DT_140]|nr:hypothetical protein [Rivularia sp. ALOHA_DT_140]
MNNNKKRQQIFIAGTVAGGTSLIASSSPVLADTTTNGGVTAVNALVTDLGTITAAVTAIIVGAMGVRMAIKFVNRMTVKG